MTKRDMDLLSVHINVEIPATALQAIVANAKLTAPKDENGTYRIDTADYVSTMITQFLLEKNFEKYVADINNYKTDS